jgi:hypothetical protein
MRFKLLCNVQVIIDHMTRDVSRSNAANIEMTRLHRYLKTLFQSPARKAKPSQLTIVDEADQLRFQPRDAAGYKGTSCHLGDHQQMDHELFHHVQPLIAGQEYGESEISLPYRSK